MTPTTAELGSPIDADMHDRAAYFDRLREIGGVVWDDGMNAWLVTSYELVRQMTRDDEIVWGRNYVIREGVTHLGLSDEDWEWFMSGGSARAMLVMNSGEGHTAQHRWWMRVFSPRLLEHWRDRLFEPACRDAIDRIIGLGRTELGREYAGPVTQQVIAGMLGLPIDDPDWLARLAASFDARTELMARDIMGLPPDADVQERAFAASHELYAELLPHVRAKQTSADEDFISLIWKDAPTLFGADFNETDVFSAAVTMWQGGAGSTWRGSMNALYLTLVHPELHDRLRTDERARRNFVEESFRLYDFGPWKPRYAKRATELGGVRIEEGDRVLAVTAAAHLDPSAYEHPHEVDLERPSPRGHFGFFAGPRACPGQGLARLEIEELMLGLLERLPGASLDPDAPAPAYDGTWKPLNVRW